MTIPRESVHGVPGAQPDQGTLVAALTSVDGRADLAVFRTRRRVYSTVIDMEEQRKGRSRQSKLAIVMFTIVIILLAPAVWTSVLNFSAGAHFADLQTQIALLPLMLFPGIVAVATASYMRHHNR
jgi:hypothetical protein